VRIWYVRPKRRMASFSEVGAAHVKELAKRWRVIELDEDEMSKIKANREDVVFIHPLFYLANKYKEDFSALIRDRRFKLIGVDVADSDRISEYGVRLANLCDAVVVPSRWAKEVYEKSGVQVPVYVVPHALFPEFLAPKRPPSAPRLRELWKKKIDDNLVYILYICQHSPRRKGFDLVKRVLEAALRERGEKILPIFHGGVAGVMSWYLKGECIVKRGKCLIDRRLLVQVYDLCDVYLLFSRGGGFELCGLEALARGLVVLAPEAGPWTEYLPRESLVKVARWAPVLHENLIHVGLGPEIDVDDAVEKLVSIVDSIGEWRARFAAYAKEAREKWTWERSGAILRQVMEEVAG